MNALSARSVILVDDDDEVRAAVSQSLELAGFQVAAFMGASAALASLPQDFPGVIVTDIRMPDIDGLQLFASVRQRDAGLPVILMTGHGDVPMAVRALRDGAHDFIAKPFSTDHQIGSIERGLERRELELENRRLRASVADAVSQSPFVGETPEIVQLRDSISAIAEADLAVLIEGETGVGKGLLAQILHRASKRRGRKFIAVDCAALSPENGLEQLFGRGDSRFGTDQPKFAGAHRGTLYLDSIDRLAQPLQPALLKAVEDQAVVGSGASSYPADVRMIASCRSDLRRLVEDGRFAEDLFYALRVVRVSIPPLRERRADIPLLFVHFLEEAAVQLKRPVPRINDALRKHILEQEWLGNVRELRSYAFKVCAGLEREVVSGASSGDASLADRVSRFEASIIRSVLRDCRGNAGQAMALLQTPRKTFYDKLARHRIDIAEYRS